MTFILIAVILGMLSMIGRIIRREQMQRNDCIDVMKCVAAFMVIIIHRPFLGMFGEIIMPLTRVAVPFFFMVSGYYLGNVSDGIMFSHIKNKIAKIAKLLLAANAGYFVWGIFMTLLKGNDVSTYLQRIFHVENLISFLFLNESPFAVHLWFLGALLYAQILVCLLFQIRPIQTVYVLIPVLFLVELAFGKYSLFLFHREFDYLYVRNFAFTGIPYLLMGHCIYTYREKINTWKDEIIFSGIVFFSVSGILEKRLLVKLSLNAAREHYISTIFLALCLLAFAIKHPSFGRGTKIANWGRRYSLMIYLTHILFLQLFAYFLRNQKDRSLYYVIAPFLTAMLSLFLSYLLCRLQHRRKGSTTF